MLVEKEKALQGFRRAVCGNAEQDCIQINHERMGVGHPDPTGRRKAAEALQGARGRRGGPDGSNSGCAQVAERVREGDVR